MTAAYPSLKNKVVFITGGGSGIGACFVQMFHEQGCKVAFISRKDDEGLVKKFGVWFQACDVTDPEALQKALADAADKLGAIDVMINNVANDTRQKTIDVDVKGWHDGLAVNLDPTFIASTAVYPGMKARGGGVILNISSINAILGPPQLATYVAAKGAINAMTKTLSHEWGADNVRVNVISPGWIVTQRQLDLWLTPEAEKAWMKLVSLQKRIYPKDVAQLALFLASEDASMITGQNFVIDGGRT